MASTRIAFNPTTGPVVYDDAGRVVAALDRVEVDGSSDVVKAAIDSGRLVWAPTTTSRKGDA